MASENICNHNNVQQASSGSKWQAAGRNCLAKPSLFLRLPLGADCQAASRRQLMLAASRHQSCLAASRRQLMLAASRRQLHSDAGCLSAPVLPGCLLAPVLHGQPLSATLLVKMRSGLREPAMRNVRQLPADTGIGPPNSVVGASERSNAGVSCIATQLKARARQCSSGLAMLSISD